jgi:hypothetical protein
MLIWRAKYYLINNCCNFIWAGSDMMEDSWIYKCLVAKIWEYTSKIVIIFSKIGLIIWKKNNIIIYVIFCYEIEFNI